MAGCSLIHSTCTYKTHFSNLTLGKEKKKHLTGTIPVPNHWNRPRPKHNTKNTRSIDSSIHLTMLKAQGTMLKAQGSEARGRELKSRRERELDELRSRGVAKTRREKLKDCKFHLTRTRGRNKCLSDVF